MYQMNSLICRLPKSEKSSVPWTPTLPRLKSRDWFKIKKPTAAFPSRLFCPFCKLFPPKNLQTQLKISSVIFFFTWNCCYIIKTLINFTKKVFLYRKNFRQITKKCDNCKIFREINVLYCNLVSRKIKSKVIFVVKWLSIDLTEFFPNLVSRKIESKVIFFFVKLFDGIFS